MTAVIAPTQSPSAWGRRVLLASLAAGGLVLASYLALYQLGLLHTVFDPLFGAGSRKVLDLTAPVPDAAVGAAAYATEVVLTFVGGEDRWRTRPHVVLLFGAVIASGAVVSVALILMQAFVADAWCTLCLASAAVSLLLFVLGAHEPWAAVRQARADG